MSSFTNTSNLDLRNYDPVANPEWDHSDLVAAAEERLVVTDDDGAKADFTPYATALYVDRAADEIYAGDGSSWNLVATRTESAADLSDVSADSVSDAHHAKTSSGDIDHDSTVGGTDADAHHAAFEPSAHDSRDHASALSSTFAPSDGDHIAFSGGSWTTEQPPSVGTGSVDGEAIAPQSVNNEVYASQFSGAGLASKVENAVQWLQNNAGGQGRVRVTPRDDGAAWSWDKEVVFDISDDEGIEIDVDDGVAIDYGGTGWAITIDNSWSGVTGDQRFKIVGGRWEATGNPEGWLRVQDGFRTYIHPSRVDFSQSSNLGCAISIENQDSYSESTQIRGTYVADIGARFLSAAETGGSGTDSFHDTWIAGAHINAYNIGLRLSGRVDMSEITKPSLFAKTDGVTLLELDGGRMEGLTITSPKFENIGSNSNVTPIASGSNYDPFYGPLMVGGKFGSGLSASDNDSGADVQWINPYGNELHLGKPNGGDVVIDGGGLSADGTTYSTSNLSGTTGSTTGEVKMDDGTNTSHGDPDLCVWTGSEWRQVGASTTFT